MVFIYNLAFLIFGLFYSPVFLNKIRQAQDPKLLLRQRIGIFPESWCQKLLGKKIIWLHAVSVGEVQSVRRLVNEFLDRTKEYHFVITTVTPTGQKIAKELEGDKVTVCYFPFDLTFAVRRFFSIFRPECLFLVETEIWPNLLTEAQRMRVPVGILNARMSRQSEKNYRRFGKFFRPLFGCLSFVIAQSRIDAERFSRLGVPREALLVLGNIKFDNVSLERLDSSRRNSMKLQWGFTETDRILIAGSTHPGEEKIIADIYQDLREEYPQLKLLIAPRHIERSRQLAGMFRRRDLRAVLSTSPGEPGIQDVLILNQIGVLKELYQIADLVIMGGSLVRHGGQNPIEPACFQRPIVHGPHVFNFEGIYRTFDSHGGAILVQDRHQLALALNRLLKNPVECRKLGENAFKVVQDLLGATQRYTDWLFEFLSHKPLERKRDVQFSEKLFQASSRRP